MECDRPDEAVVLTPARPSPTSTPRRVLRDTDGGRLSKLSEYPRWDRGHFPRRRRRRGDAVESSCERWSVWRVVGTQPSVAVSVAKVGLVWRRESGETPLPALDLRVAELHLRIPKRHAHLRICVQLLRQPMGRGPEDLREPDRNLSEVRQRHGEASDQRRQLHPEGGRLVRGPLLVDAEEGRGRRDEIGVVVVDHLVELE